MSRDPSSRFYQDPNIVEEFHVKLYHTAELVIEVLRERAMKAKLERPDDKADFIVIHIAATRSEFKAAQIEWERRMMVGLPYPAPKQAGPEPEIDLFA